MTVAQRRPADNIRALRRQASARSAAQAAAARAAAAQSVVAQPVAAPLVPAEAVPVEPVPAQPVSAQPVSSRPEPRPSRATGAATARSTVERSTGDRVTGERFTGGGSAGDRPSAATSAVLPSPEARSVTAGVGPVAPTLVLPPARPGARRASRARAEACDPVTHGPAPAPPAGRRPGAVLVDVYGTLLQVEALRSRFRDVGRPAHEFDLFLAHALRDARGLALAGGTPTPFDRVVDGALRSATGHTLGDEAIAHLVACLTALPSFPDAEPAFAVLARGHVPVWALAQGSGSDLVDALDPTGLRSFLRGAVATDDLGFLLPHPEAYRLACLGVRTEPAETAFVSTQADLVHGAVRAGLIGGLVLREGARPPAFMDPPHVTGRSLVEVTERLLALRG